MILTITITIIINIQKYSSDENENESVIRYRKSDSESDSYEDNKTQEEIDEDRRIEDIKERDEFANRLLGKEKDKTKSIHNNENNNKKQESEYDKILAMSRDDKERTLAERRRQARMDYVRDRAGDKLEELNQDIQDEETLFENTKLTKKEKREYQDKRNIYNIASEYMGIGKDQREDRYEMPEAYTTEKEGNDRIRS